MSPIVLSLTSSQAKSQVSVKLSSSQHYEITVCMKNLDKIALRLYLALLEPRYEMHFQAEKSIL